MPPTTRWRSQRRATPPLAAPPPPLLRHLQMYTPTRYDVAKATHLDFGFRVARGLTSAEKAAGWLYTSGPDGACAACVARGCACVYRPLRAFSPNNPKGRRGELYRRACEQCNRRTSACSGLKQATAAEWKRLNGGDGGTGAEAAPNNAPLPTPASLTPAPNNAGHADEDVKPVVSAARRKPSYRVTYEVVDSDDSDDSDDNESGPPARPPSARPSRRPQTAAPNLVHPAAPHPATGGPFHAPTLTTPAAPVPALGPAPLAGPQVSLSNNILLLNLAGVYAITGIQYAGSDLILASRQVGMNPMELQERLPMDDWVLKSILRTGVVPSGLVPPPDPRLYLCYLHWGLAAYKSGAVPNNTGLSLHDLEARSQGDWSSIVTHIQAAFQRLAA